MLCIFIKKGTLFGRSVDIMLCYYNTSAALSLRSLKLINNFAALDLDYIHLQIFLISNVQYRNRNIENTQFLYII